MDSIFYLNKTGCQWRMLPKDFPPHNTVFYYFNKRKWTGVIEEVLDRLHELAREIIGKEASPSLGIIDSRSVKTSHHTDKDKGYRWG